MQFKVGNACFSHTVMVVRGLQCDCILGRDVLRNIPCKIESNGETIYFSIESEQIPSKVEPFAKLVLKRKLKIPGNHEMLVNAKVRRLGGQTIPDIAMVERNYDLFRHQGLMVASTCVSMDNDSVVVRILNPTPKDISLSRKTIIGFLEEVSMVYDEDSKTRTDDQESDSEFTDSDTEKLFNTLNIESSNLSNDQLKMARDMITKHRQVFAMPNEPLGCTDVLNHTINTEGAVPIQQRPRRFPQPQRHEIRKQVQEMLAQNVIEPSQSPWSSPVVLVAKPDGTTRFGTAHSGPGPSSCQRSSPSARPPGCASPLGLGQSTHFGFGPSTHFGGRSKYNSLPVAQLVIYFGSLRERDSVNRGVGGELESWKRLNGETVGELL